MKNENQLIYESYSDTRDLNLYDLKNDEYYQVVSGKEKEWKGFHWNIFPFTDYSTKSDLAPPSLLVEVNTLAFKVLRAENDLFRSRDDSAWIKLTMLHPKKEYMYKTTGPFNFIHEGDFIPLVKGRVDTDNIAIYFPSTTKFKQLDDQDPIVMQDLF